MVNRSTQWGFWAFALAAMSYLLTLDMQPYPLSFIVKALPIWILIWIVFSARSELRQRWVIVGLAFSSVGDLLLAWNLFIPGLSAFLVGHLFYIAAFARHIRLTTPRFNAALIMLVATGTLVSQLLPYLAEMTVPVVVYITVILCMALSATLGGNNHPMIAVGAALFLVSDSLIAVNRFMFEIPHERELVMVTYYAAQLFIAAGAIRRWPARQ